MLAAMNLISSCKTIGFANKEYCDIDKIVRFRQVVIDAMQEDEKRKWIAHNKKIKELCQ